MTWQDLIVGLAALAAAAWLVADRRRRRKRKAACDTCVLTRGATPPRS